MTKEERIRLWESYNSKVNKLERELLDEVTKHLNLNVTKLTLN